MSTDTKDESSPADLPYFVEYGTGAPLLLVHGIMVTGEMFAPIVEQLSARHRLIVPDLRGSGKSRHLPPPYTVQRQAADLVRLLDHLGVESTDVLGYSQGGPVAQQLALDHPRRVNRLVLSNTYAHNMATVRERIEGRLVPILIRILGMRRFARFIIALGLRRVSAERARWVLDLIADQDPDIMRDAWAEAMAFDSRQRLAEIGSRTLIIAGANDDAVPVHHARMLHDGIPGSRLVVIDHADHALIWARPDEFLRAIGGFLTTGGGP